MFEKILLVPASDEPGQPGLRRLLALARTGAEIHIFRPVHEPLLEGHRSHHTELYATLRRSLVDERRAAAERIAAECRARGFETSVSAVWDRAYDQAITREALERQSDLVVAEPQRGRSAGLTQQDWRLFSTCPAPVLVIKSDAKAPYRHIVAAVDPMHEHAKPRDLDAAVVAVAKAIREPTGATLSVLHCYTPLAELPIASADYVPLEDAERALEQARRDAVTELVEGAGLEADAAILVAGRPRAVLQAMTERGEADLVVMGALARGRLEELLIGSTAERLLERSSADVLIVKPPALKLAIGAVPAH